MKTTWIALLLLAIPAVLAFRPQSTRGSKTRGPASLYQHRYGKAQGEFLIEIVPQIDSGSVVELEARITAKQAITDVNFDWILPDGMSSGDSLQGIIGSMNEGETKTARIRITKAHDEIQQIHFRAFRWQEGEKLGVVAQYNTQVQNQIDEKIQAKAQAMELEFQESASAPRLIQ